MMSDSLVKRRVQPISGLKGQDTPAQGNALGIDMKCSFSPVRASQMNVSQPSVSPFQGSCQSISPNPGRCPGLICDCPLLRTNLSARPWKRLFCFCTAVAIAIAMSLSPVAAEDAEVTLVEKGAPRVAIVLPEQPAKDEQLAAQELADHLKQMSGADVPIRTEKEPLGNAMPIRVGLSFAPQCAGQIKTGGDDPASFLLRVTLKDILLAGLSPEGTLFAAYELLEQLGVRWFMPGEIGTVVPARDTVTLKCQATIQHPGFAGRILSDMGGKSGRTWFRRVRMGGFNAGGHGLGIRVDREKEPELFMQINGRPTSKVRVSHPEVQRRVIAASRGRLDKYPDLKYLPIGPADGAGFGDDPWDAGDMDPLHGKVSVTDRFVKFFNIVLEEVNKTHPDVGIAFYCYAQYMRPPVREKPNPKIMPVLAPIDVCRFHAIDNPLCPERAYIKEIVDAWQALGLEMMYRGYLFNLADQGFPFTMIRQIRSEYPYYHRQGFKACRVECKPAWGYHGPSLYLAAKIMWDPGLDVDALLNDYFARLYGPAAEPMQEHFERLERAYAEADYHTGNVFDIPHILTPGIMKDLRRSLEKAEKAARREPVLARRVNMVRIGYDFGAVNLAMMAAVNAFDFVEAKRQYDYMQTELIPVALEHVPPILNPRYAPGFTKRFWSGTVESGVERTTGGSEIAVELPDEWQFMLDPLNGGEALAFHKPGMGDRNWTMLRTKSDSWSNQGLRYYKGEAWYRTRFMVPVKYRGRDLRLWFGGIDDTAKAWINGVALEQLAKGAAPIGRPWEFDATPAVALGKQNMLVVKISNRAVNELGTGGITGPAMIYAPAPADSKAGKAHP